MTPPVFGHGELRLVLLTLIAERPRHGYELIQALTDHFDGGYSPSAGTIYPRLAKLEQEGLVSKREDGRKTVYAITDAGRREVDERSAEFDRITLDSTATLSSVADEARTGLAEARSGLRAELDRIAAEARSAAEAAAAATAAHATGQPGPRPAPTPPAEADGGDEPDARVAGTASAPFRAAAAGDARGDAAADGAESAERDSTRGGADAGAAGAATDGAGAADGAAPGGDGTGPDEAAAEDADERVGRKRGGPIPRDGLPFGFVTPVDAFDDPHAELLRRIDAAVQRFRMNLRHDAREGARSELLDAEGVDALEQELVRLGRDFAARLRIHR